MKEIKSMEEWNRLEKANIELLDSLDLPKPEIGEEVYDYMNSVQGMFENLELPPEYRGNMFEFVDDQLTLGRYLEKRFNMTLEEEIRYVMF